MNAAPQMQEPRTNGALTNTKPNALDSIAAAESRQKETATWIAKLALASHAVHKLKNGDFICCKYNLSYYAKNFDDLKAFAIKLGLKP